MKEFLSIAEFCDYLKISESTAHKISSRGLLPKYKPFGKKIFFKWTEVNSYLEKHRIPSNQELEDEVMEMLSNQK